jgi:putative sigma-54 modulation protein
MNVIITARKFKAHDTLKQFVKDELSMLSKFNDDIISADVKLSYQNPTNSIKIADITVSIPGQILKATDKSEDFKKSVTSSVEKIIKQLKTIKSKRTTARVK